MRALFTMFAEDVDLLPEKCFTQILHKLRQEPTKFQPAIEDLWKTMNTGGYSGALFETIRRFNGGLFEEVSAIPLNADQIELLAEAAQADWRDVEPAIFGTLLERALDPVERHKLGAHYTPRAYVERLVEPTVMEPLRSEWAAVQTAALLLSDKGETAKAQAEVDGFLRTLAETRVLDPACGSGNFLYVTLAKMKELEAEVLDVQRKLGGAQLAMEIESVRVTPQQFLGIEVNPRAAAIAELVLWIGYLQWHLRTHGTADIPDPVLQAYHNIECRDAVLAWDNMEPLLNDEGRPVTRWDGRTTKTHPVTGEQVPDETARIPAYKYINPRPAEWPAAEYIVGNPPFIGNKRMREALGDGYVEALRESYKGSVPNSADYVMYWWDRSASLLSSEQLYGFGLITTNSITQTFNRRIVHKYLLKNQFHISFAIPDHPWVDSSDGAAVRVAMTAASSGHKSGRLQLVVDESNEIVSFSQYHGFVNPDLSIGIDVTNAKALDANSMLATRGVIPLGQGFVISKDEATNLASEDHILGTIIRPFRNGRDLAQVPRDRMIIDLFGLSIEDVMTQYPEIYQWILQRVKPERDQKKRKSNRELWWIFGEARSTYRPALDSISRYIATVETSKHRIFQFLDRVIVPDDKLVAVALDNAYFLGVLSSRLHCRWAVVLGGKLGMGNDAVYQKSNCFDKFPFPDPTEDQKARIRDLAEQLDAHRKRQQSLHPKLTLTNMYNVLEKLRANESGAEEALTAKEKETHEQGLVSILKQIHDDLDAAVFDAYGWPHDLTDEEILERLVALNAERAAEEANGHIRWLRPEYQAPETVAPEPEAVQSTLMPLEDEAAKSTKAAAPAAAPTEKIKWPKSLADQAQAVRGILVSTASPASVRDVAGHFAGRATKTRLGNIESLLETLVALGQAEVDGERFSVV